MIGNFVTLYVQWKIEKSNPIVEESCSLENSAAMDISQENIHNQGAEASLDNADDTLDESNLLADIIPQEMAFLTNRTTLFIPSINDL